MVISSVIKKNTEFKHSNHVYKEQMHMFRGTNLPDNYLPFKLIIKDQLDDSRILMKTLY